MEGILEPSLEFAATGKHVEPALRFWNFTENKWLWFNIAMLTGAVVETFVHEPRDLVTVESVVSQN